MEHIIFSCMGMPLPSQEIKYGSQYIRLYGRVPNKKGAESFRCGVSILRLPTNMLDQWGIWKHILIRY